MKTSFTVAERYLVECEWSPFGLETYSVDGKEVFRLRSLRTLGSRRFIVGSKDDLHEVRIEIDAKLSLKSIIDPCNWTAEAYVDDVLVVDDLTPTRRRWLSRANRIANGMLVVTFSFLVVALLVLGILRLCMG